MESENTNNANIQNNQEAQKKVRSTFENIIQSLLKSAQVKTEATSNIIAKLNEFSMKYLCEMIEEAKLFAEYANRANITAEDVNLVLKKNKEKYQKIPQNQLEELAKQRNKIKLNAVLEPGMKFPHNDFLLTKTVKNLLIEDNRLKVMSEDSKNYGNGEMDNNLKSEQKMTETKEEFKMEGSISEEIGNEESSMALGDIKSENSSNESEHKPKKKIKK